MHLLSSLDVEHNYVALGPIDTAPDLVTPRGKLNLESLSPTDPADRLTVHKHFVLSEAIAPVGLRASQVHHSQVTVWHLAAHRVTARQSGGLSEAALPASPPAKAPTGPPACNYPRSGPADATGEAGSAHDCVTGRGRNLARLSLTTRDSTGISEAGWASRSTHEFDFGSATL